MVPVSIFALFAVFHGRGAPQRKNVTFFCVTGWYRPICLLNIKNNLRPPGGPILALRRVLSGTRQQHVPIAVFQGTSAPDMEHTAFLSPIG